MSEIKLNAEALEEAGAALGFAVAALIRGFQAGMDAYDVMLEETAIREIRKPKRNGNVPLKRKSAIAGSAGAINARGWRNARRSARASRRTGCTLPRA